MKHVSVRSYEEQNSGAERDLHHRGRIKPIDLLCELSCQRLACLGSMRDPRTQNIDFDQGALGFVDACTWSWLEVSALAPKNGPSSVACMIMATAPMYSGSIFVGVRELLPAFNLPRLLLYPRPTTAFERFLEPNLQP